MTFILNRIREKRPGVKRLLLRICFLPLLLPAPLPASVDLILHGPTLTLSARDASLYDILTAFAAYGITVEAQPGITSRFNGTLSRQEIDPALDQLFQNHPHNTTWREIPFHDGFVRILSGIQVYAPGSPALDPMQPIPPLPAKIQRLPSGEAYLADEILLGMRPGSDTDTFRRLLANMGGQIVSVNRQTGIYRVRLPQNTLLPALLDQLAQNDFIAIAEPNFIYPLLTPESRQTPNETFTDPPPAIRAPAPGQAALAIIDSGLNPDTLPRDILRASRDVTGADLPLRDPVGHGTHMALIASGLSGTPGHPPSGAAVPLVAIRAFDSEGNTHSFGILEALTFSAESGARVISMSWGAYTESTILAHAFHQAADQGLILLASAGNDGKDRLMFPAAYPSVLAVGAAAPDGTREPYSNHGPGLDLLAPGTALLTDGNMQTVLRGTSMATPWVAAALTAYLHQNPDTPPGEII